MRQALFDWMIEFGLVLTLAAALLVLLPGCSRSTIDPRWVGTCVHPLVDDGKPFNIDETNARVNWGAGALMLQPKNGPEVTVIGARCAYRRR